MTQQKIDWDAIDKKWRTALRNRRGVSLTEFTKAFWAELGGKDLYFHPTPNGSEKGFGDRRMYLKSTTKVQTMPQKIDWEAINKEWEEKWGALKGPMDLDKFNHNFWLKYGGAHLYFDKGARGETTQRTYVREVTEDVFQMEYSVLVIDEKINAVIISNAMVCSTGMNALLKNLTDLNRKDRDSFMHTLIGEGSAAHVAISSDKKPYSIAATKREV